jgi:putative hydrolase of the HAD superfamily
MKTIKGLIFDFDGLIIDTEYAKYLSWQEIFQSFQVDLSFEVIESIFWHADGSNSLISHLEDKVGRKLDAQVIIQRALQRFHEILSQFEMRAGVYDYLVQADQMGLKMVLASNAKHAQIQPLIDRLQIGHFFRSILTSEDVRNPKPDPELLNLTVQRMALETGEVIAFDDSNIGLKAARSAGIFCVVVPNQLTIHFYIDHPDLLLPSFTEKTLYSLLEDTKHSIL